MRTAKLLALALVAAAVPACSTFNMNLHDTPPEFPDEPVFDVHVGTNALGDWDGNLVNASVLGTGARKGELAMIDVWPIAGVGVGPLGLRVRVLPIELGLGIGFYAPSQATGGGEGMAGE